MRSCETDRPSQSEVIDILKSGWHDKSYDEQDADGTYRYRITGHALTGRKGSAVVTFAELKSGRRLLIITVF